MDKEFSVFASPGQSSVDQILTLYFDHLSVLIQRLRQVEHISLDESVPS